MNTKISAINPYMRDSVLRERSVLRSVATSSAIEGIHAPFKQIARQTIKRAQPSNKRRRSAKR